MSVLHRKKPLRDWLITADEGAKALHITKQGFKALVREGFIRSADRAGMYRLGAVIDGHAEAVRLGRLAPPHKRTNAPAVFFCEVLPETPALPYSASIDQDGL
ncbi:hypothetical protein HNR26_003810 [Rhizobium rosettiformans]|uniref:Uncharacterized protein n=2 Tax=Rhizobium rosettiformans TaxID=1368430 RepID=A0A4S8PPS7_9HYPH|nr:hypothetical protein [Rhizobium rosettiformans]MBB5277729.1 hypothetical protein [Rhizobium rosettiformans]THV33063.1 hypothetical protein FAA86_17880 [Rhizobium rosettiformans W3]